MEREMKITKHSFTPKDAKVREFLEKVADLAETSGQYELKVQMTFSDNVPIMMETKELDTYMVEVEATYSKDDYPDEVDVVYAEFVFSQDDDTWTGDGYSTEEKEVK